MTQPAPVRLQTALVIDDDEIACALAQQILLAMGFAKVYLAENGARGLAMLAALQPAPDLMLCDIFMPEKDGIEFVMELAQRRYPGGLVLVSGGEVSMLRMAAQIAELNGLRVLASLHKPLGTQALAQALQRLDPPVTQG